MKAKLFLITMLMMGITLTYTACKKSSSTPAGPALTPKEVTSQIALNLSQTLYSGFGAFNLNQGLNSPGSLGLVHTNGRLGLNSITDPLCGTVADTTLNYSTTENGVTASVKGELKFSFACTSGILSGFNVYANLAVAESNADLSASVKLLENLTLLAQNPQSDNSNAVLSGTLGYDGTYAYKTGTKGSGAQNFSYTLKSIIIDPNGDILSGSATFATQGSGSAGVWNYTGSIVFLGSGKATVTINGTTYNVDLTTGTVS